MKSGIPTHQGREGATRITGPRHGGNPGGHQTDMGYCKTKYGGNGVTANNHIPLGVSGPGMTKADPK